MSKLAAPPNPSTSMHEEAADASDQPNGSSKAPPPQGGSSSSSPSDSNGPSNPPPSPSSGGSRSSPPSNSEGSPSSRPPPPSSGNPPPSHSSPPPPPSPSHSSWNGGSSNSSPPPNQPSDSSGNSGGSNSPPPPNWSSPPQQSGGSTPSPPPPPSPSSPQAPPTPSAGSASSSGASPSPPQWSNNEGQSSSNPPAGGQSPPSPPPPPPANQSVVFIPIPVSSNTPPGALPPPGLVAIAPAGAIMSSHFPGSMPATHGANASTTSGLQPGSSGSTSSGSQQLPQSSSRASGGSTVAAAIAGAAVVGLLFAMVAAFLVLSRRRRKKTDGLVYHYDGNYNMQSGQFVGSNQNQSGAMYPPPPGTGNLGGGGGYYQYQSGSMEAPPPGAKSSFSYEELTSITSNFSRDNVIGEGGFGYVYKGWLGDGKCVAVKQLKAGSGQGEREFQAEVEIISRVHHRHLVSLVGYCIAQHHRMLIYEFVPNGTLEHHLHGRSVPVMDWPTRLRIAIGAAKGLAYLHEDCHPRIIHRDIKSANILLDYSFEAQVADFGLAKLSNDSHTHVSTRILGTFGYLAPEYASSGKLTDRSDVFSFGVVLLELITGRKPVDQARPLGEESLVEWARPVLVDAMETGELSGLVDHRLEGKYNRAEMARMVEAAAACVRHSAPRRPRMVQVMRALDDEGGSLSDLSNGVKVGQSQAFSSGQQEAAIQQLRRTAFASEEFTGEFERSAQ